jgi:hypothetical protein
MSPGIIRNMLLDEKVRRRIFVEKTDAGVLKKLVLQALPGVKAEG